MSDGVQEQDVAAGGRYARELRLQEGAIVLVSVAVRQFKRTPRQQYGYLQFKYEGKTVTKYIGKVSAETKGESLSIGWSMLRTRRLVEAQGWHWVG